MLPLALGLTALIHDNDDRRLILLGVAGLTLGAMIATIGLGIGEANRDIDRLLFGLTALIPLLPGVVAAGPIDLGRLRARRRSGAGGLLQSTELALAGCDAALRARLGPMTPGRLAARSLWLLALVAAARFTVRPLARLATRATLQRDLVVAATEAERARLAADIHDDALQELTLLVRRLEASGDTEGAEIGRTVADRLRAICGDLRLPILDDLGVGPALDWLVLRIERLAGGEVRLERADDARHNPDVELAIFRVAQEALAERRQARQAADRRPLPLDRRRGISLAIDDAGPGHHRRRAGRRREGRPVRAPEHGPAGGADRGDPRCQALAERRDPRRPRVAAALTLAGPGASRPDPAPRSSTTTRSSATGPRRCSRPSPGSRSPGRPARSTRRRG